MHPSGLIVPLGGLSARSVEIVGRVRYDQGANAMLVAEIHGHTVPEVAGSEDYLTSAVFGHLRYIPPAVFWEEFFARAVGLPLLGSEPTLLDFLTNSGVRLREYTSLETLFWPTHPLLGTPDLVLCFSAPRRPPVVLIIEAKLWAGKSGIGEHDQLFRYLRLLGSLNGLSRPLQSGELKSSVTALLYVTPRESLSELLETAGLCSHEVSLRARLFRAQWQDITETAEASLSTADRLSHLVLRDVSTFLKVRGLEYFRGFRRVPIPTFARTDANFYASGGEFVGFSIESLSQLTASAGSFYTGSKQFGGFQEWEDPLPRSNVHGGWVR